MCADVIDIEEKRLERLSPHELNLHLMRMPARKRLEAILQRPDAAAVVAALAEQDFYFSIKEIDPEDTLILLGSARMEQLNFLFDLEWWQKDRVQPAKAVEWIERLARASDQKLLEWLYQVDFELLVTLFKKWIRVVAAPEDVDPLEAKDQLPLHTLDDQYFWEARYVQYEDFFTRLLGTLFEVHYGFYKELMDHILWATDVEVEEDAYRFHKARLEDQAIPDFFEALEIYRSVKPEEAVRGKRDEDFRPVLSSTPSFALALIPDQDLLGQSLREIEDPLLLDMLRLELASLANKVVVADQLPPDSPDALHQAVNKVGAYVSLGLQLMNRERSMPAANILREVFLEHLFRLGQGEVAGLRNRFQHEYQQGWLSRWPKGFNCLDSEWMDSAELLLKKTPRLLKPASDPLRPPKEDFFRSLEDLSRGYRTVDVISSLDSLFEDLNPQPERLQDALWPQGIIRSIEDVTLGAMLWTAAARFLAEGNWGVEPLSVKRWREVAPLVEPEAMERVIRERADRLGLSPAKRELIEVYLLPLFEAYREEMAAFSGDNPPDPQLMKFFLFKKE